LIFNETILQILISEIGYGPEGILQPGRENINEG
jgi:hypothetical protein